MAPQPSFNTTSREEIPHAIPRETERMVLRPYGGTCKVLGHGNVATVYAVENAVALQGESIAVKVRYILEGRGIQTDVRTASFLNETAKTSHLRRMLTREGLQRVFVGNKVLNRIDEEHSTPDEKLVYRWIELPYSPSSQNLQKWLLESEKAAISLKFFLDIFEQVLVATQDCHSAGATHGDIGVDNALIEPRQRKVSLIDFGLSRFIAKEPALNWFGENSNGLFAAWGLGDRLDPALSDRRVAQPYNDVYSLGLFFLEMVVIYLLKNSASEALSLEILEYKKCPLELLDLIKSMRDENPEKRPSIATCIATVQRIKASTRILLHPEK